MTIRDPASIRPALQSTQESEKTHNTTQPEPIAQSSPQTQIEKAGNSPLTISQSAALTRAQVPSPLKEAFSQKNQTGVRLRPDRSSAKAPQEVSQGPALKRQQMLLTHYERYEEAFKAAYADQASEKKPVALARFLNVKRSPETGDGRLCCTEISPEMMKNIGVSADATVIEIYQSVVAYRSKLVEGSPEARRIDAIIMGIEMELAVFSVEGEEVTSLLAAPKQNESEEDLKKELRSIAATTHVQNRESAQLKRENESARIDMDDAFDSAAATASQYKQERERVLKASSTRSPSPTVM
jgi:hypothetical protein